jgi:hypothetical protein
MSARRVVCLGAFGALLLWGGLGRAGAKPPDPPCQEAPARLVQQVYQVADLVIPLGDPTPAEPKSASPQPTAAPTCPKGCWAASRAVKGAPTPCAPCWTASTSKAPAGPTLEAQLMKLIAATIAPQSWCEHGGSGTIDYFPLTMSLVINQTPDVHEQIAGLLAALRRLQDQEVAVEVRIATMPEEVFQSLELGGEADDSKPRPETDLAFLSDKKMAALMETIQGDARSNVMQAPKLTLFNGQTSALNVIDEQTFVTGLELAAHDGQLQVCPKTETIPLGLQMSLRPVISADRRHVELALKVKHTELASSAVPLFPVTIPLTPVSPEGKDVKPVAFTQYIQQPKVSKLALKRTLTIPDGGTAVLSGWKKQCEISKEVSPPVVGDIPTLKRLFRVVQRHSEMCRVLVMVTPRIIITEEEEERKPAAPPCHKAKEVGCEDKRMPTLPVPAWVKERLEEKSCGTSDFRTPILPPVSEGRAAPCGDPPDEAAILRALPRMTSVPGLVEQHRDDIEVVTERIVDKIDPPRFFPLLGAAQLHHCHWKCTVYYNETVEGTYPFRFSFRRPRVEVVYIDKDHLHLCGK